MNDQQKISRRNYDEAAKLRNQAATEVINRANKTAREQHQRHVNNSLKAGRRTGENVHDNRSGTGKFILVFIVMAVVAILLFALFVSIVSGLKSSPFS